jgi:tetratricopeptide (TPR) repeat protein
VGRNADAVAPIEEAVGIYRAADELVQGDHELQLWRTLGMPDGYRPDLAASLNNLSNALAAVGRRADALLRMEEAVGIYRALAAATPDAYRPDLAMSRTNLSARLGAVGRDADAVAPIEEAVGIYRALAAATPDAYRPDLARSLYNLSLRLGAVGHRADALASSQEALLAFVPLLEHSPEVLADAGLSLMQRYLRLCEELRLEPDEDLDQRMHAVFVSAGVVTAEDEV